MVEAGTINYHSCPNNGSLSMAYARIKFSNSLNYYLYDFWTQHLIILATSNGMVITGERREKTG